MQFLFASWAPVVGAARPTPAHETALLVGGRYATLPAVANPGGEIWANLGA